MTDYKEVAETLRFAYKRFDDSKQGNLDAAIDLCERMARGELVELNLDVRKPGVAAQQASEHWDGVGGNQGYWEAIARAAITARAQEAVSERLKQTYAENERLRQRVAELEARDVVPPVAGHF